MTIADHPSITFAQASALARNSSWLHSAPRRERPAVVLWMGQPSTPASHSATLFSFMLRPIVGSLLIGMLRVAKSTHTVILGDGCLESVSTQLFTGDLLVYIGINYLGAFSRMGLAESRSCQNMPHLARASSRGAYVILYSTDSRCQLNSQVVPRALHVLVPHAYSMHACLMHAYVTRRSIDASYRRLSRRAVKRYMPSPAASRLPPPTGCQLRARS